MSAISEPFSPRRARTWTILPTEIGDTGVALSHGQTAGSLAAEHRPRYDSGCRLSDEPRLDRTMERYGRSRFGRACLRRGNFIEDDVRFCVVNMFDTVFAGPTWDCHADGGASMPRSMTCETWSPPCSTPPIPRCSMT